MRERLPVQVGVAAELGWIDEHPDVPRRCDCRATYSWYVSLADPVVAEWIQQTATGLDPCTSRANACRGYTGGASPACLNLPS